MSMREDIKTLREYTHCFAVWVGERNDSLIFTMGGSFFYGQKIHSQESSFDEERLFIQMIRVKKPEGNFVKTKISEGISLHMTQERRLLLW